MNGFVTLRFLHCLWQLSCHHSSSSTWEIGVLQWEAVPPHGAAGGSGSPKQVHRCDHGYSGRSHDASVFQGSHLCTPTGTGVFMPLNPTITIEVIQIPPHMVTTATYPLQKWLMTLCASNVDQDQATFNKVHSCP